MTHKNRILRTVCLLTMALAMTGCKDDLTSLFGGDGEIEQGDAVMFTTYVPGTATTRAATPEQEAFDGRMQAYTAVNADYVFNIEMYQEGEGGNDPVLLGSSTYQPTVTTVVENEGEENETTTVTYASDGTLTTAPNATPLHWPGNAKNYGFRATAGTATLQSDQATGEKLLQQDRLEGYGFVPLWDTDNNQEAYDEEQMNFRTSKQWYADNRSVGMVPEGQDASTYYKKIPLYLRHQRSLVTIRLKAGEGVRREDLAFSTAEYNIETDIYSYDGSTRQTITPYAAQSTVDYTSADYGEPQSGVETTEYTAVVEPYDYLAGATNDVIAEIRLSGQRFTFYASNDSQYSGFTQDDAADIQHMQNYVLEAGKHLVITATLGRGSRKILITAYVEDWTETVTTSIVDDYGQAGDPIQINSRIELRQFLEGPNNKAGNVAIIVPNSLNLEQELGVPTDWVPQPLNCTLNMAGATLYTNHQVFSEIAESGNLVNGTVSVGNTTVESAVTATNYGTIERITVVPKDKDGIASTGSATKAGMAAVNSGSILGCTSQLPVTGSGGFVGGIAARSVYPEGANVMPVIDGCVVNARVDGTGTTRGGGIVGEAVGRVTNNTNEYGITLLQNADNFKNIVQSKAAGTETLRAYGNSWPTTAINNIVAETNINEIPLAERYTGVIDSQRELAYALSNYNNSNNIIRIANDFEVTKAPSTGLTNGWDYGLKQNILNESGKGNVFFRLEGNDKTITTDAMLFANIENDITNLTIRLSDDLIATPDATGGDIMAPLAYSVYAPAGKTVTISNIQVKAGDHRVQATTPAGVVVWAYGPGNAVVEDCQSNATVCVWAAEIGADATVLAGGVVACAARATITRCQYHKVSGTLFRNMSETYDGEVVVNNSVANIRSIYFGGILGGAAPVGNPAEYPSVTITDCSSWYSTSGNTQKGAIVGYACYKQDNNLKNGFTDVCQGNWWDDNSDAVGTGVQGMSDEKIVGKRNAVQPTANPDYDL